MSIIYLSASTICSISSFVLCSVHGTSITCLNIHMGYPYFKCLKSQNDLFVESVFRFHTTQKSYVIPNKCFHLTFLQVKAEGSSHEVSFLVESFFPQSNSPSLVLLHDNKIDNVNPCPLKIYWNPFSKIFRLGVI